MQQRWFIILVLITLLSGTMACMAAYQVVLDEPASYDYEPAPTSSVATQSPLRPTATSQSPSASSSCQGDDCAEVCMGNLSSYLSDAGKSQAPTHGSLYERTGDEEVVLITYDIIGDQIVNGAPENVPQNLRSLRDDTAAHERIWDYYAAIIPPEERTMLNSLVIFTDGIDNTLAWVDTSQKDDTMWDLGIDIRDTRDPRELTYTLIHEYAHLITLSDDQMPYSSRGCNTYSSDGFCATPNSYINQFVEAFWLGHLNEWEDINAINDDDTYYQYLDDFYYNYEDEFVTDYAVTSPEEDLAETWSFFVLAPRPYGDTIAEQKILFLYNFPELVDLRTQIVNRLCAYAGQ